ncbi:beta-lactamase-like protein [Dichotomocladium elegans]|nr:beta-lactamase-like protein [Dichotomocladium elegans]
MLQRNQLAPLPAFAKLSDRVWRVLGLNPSSFTLQGTNTYLVGSGNRKILIDCGQGMLEYGPLLQRSLLSISPDAYISDVILTHCHVDHWGGLDDLLAMDAGIRVHKYPLDPASYDHQHFMDGFPVPAHYLLQDGQAIRIDDDTTLLVIHTPGHTADHCSFWLEEESAIFTGDCVLGYGTVTFSDLQTYLDTLYRLLDFQPQRLYPGHGPVVESGVTKIQEYITYREQRENEILVLMASDRSKPWTPVEIGTLLRDDKPGELQPAYLRGIALHLIKLERDGKLRGRIDRSRSESDQNDQYENVYTLLNKEFFFISSSRL